MAAGLPDISSRFTFRNWTLGGCFFKEAAGELGVPGQVMKHRDEDAQEELSEGSGEHAGHMIGIQFGAPGGIENMGLQNPNMNTYARKYLQNAFRGNGGSYYKLELDWKKKLQSGSRIWVVVQDKYQLGEERPFTRTVQWTETKGKQTESLTIEFPNFSSPQLRNARGETPGPVTNGGMGATVIPLFGRKP
ncbi:hypothetical protein [Alloacidobacterium sp.]|uniref:hypothetical protein n=1 Tax=Alloacidobacterium sp. TaxID=2951999 RepID=UPI002D57A925|nr:hypothetical protein [Alloacidobacterium sp.]HYK36159.1 hypothetical protein [Alloacidobacterium sp.]